MKKLVAIALLLAPSAWAADKPEYQNVDPKIRQWFRDVHSPQGIPCCNIADGHSTTWRKSDVPGFEYEVPIQGEWIPIPPSAIIRNANNPTGDAIVWYVKQYYTPGFEWSKNGWFIRCFVLGNGA